MGPRNISLLTARGKQSRDVTWAATLKTRILDIKTRGADMCESSLQEILAVWHTAESKDSTCPLRSVEGIVVMCV